ncbi:alcohol dehydrogenase catalytic domain-containing protein [Rhodoferax sp.]|uniref:alcohol dehydrogenase catalytic domain-containing protein n=1 Tax=Rhodoferax sp. TaxID=50421 RepID=UPI00374DF67B
MKASYINGFGGPEVVRLGNFPAPAPQAHESAVRIEMASVNPLGLKMIAGYMEQVFPVTFPYTPGTDFSGVIDTVGSAVTHLKQGDRVVGRTAPSVGAA